MNSIKEADVLRILPRLPSHAHSTLDLVAHDLLDEGQDHRRLQGRHAHLTWGRQRWHDVDLGSIT